ncbi:MAG: UbiX family flavin prenyltransferase [Armatimonadota bacterium]
MTSTGRIAVAITGASGIIYAKRFLEIIPSFFQSVYLTISSNAMKIMKDELDILNVSDLFHEKFYDIIKQYDQNDLFAPPASGSHSYDGLVVIPCSSGALGRIASGVSNDLITRAADVCLKEKRKLILVVRESPLNLIQLRNMTALAEAGAVILPACPAFYHNPDKMEDLVDFVVDRVLLSLGVDARAIEGWAE